MRVADYEVLVELGRGGMSDLFIAEGSSPNAPVIIKSLRPPITKQRIDMFLDEARLGLMFDHPNVVRTIKTGEENGRPYLVMDLLDGEPLDRIIRRMNAAATSAHHAPPLLCWVVAESLAGLHYAHELTWEGRHLQIVHRDLSPSNIFVTYSGVVKVLDFGIAKSAGRLSQTTTTGDVKGKMRYMAPEQALGMRIDRRSDIFAAGAVLYELASGRHFWRRERHDREIFDLLVSGEYDADLAPLSPGLQRIVAKATSRDAFERYRTADEMRADLLAELGGAIGAPDVATMMSELFADQRDRISQAIAAGRRGSQ